MSIIIVVVITDLGMHVSNPAIDSLSIYLNLRALATISSSLTDV